MTTSPFPSSSDPQTHNNDRIPILLLKTKSTPNDGYHDEFSSPPRTTNGISFAPTFVPVLEHKLLDEGMNIICSLLKNKEIGNKEGCKYGGMIFTSQRAVEAFGLLVCEGQKDDNEYPHLQNVPIYTVGPATSRALSSIPTKTPLNIFGRETGNGESLAHYILSHYPFCSSTPSTSTSTAEGNTIKKNVLPLLFLVGETRRDIIPKTLSTNNIGITEIEVYGTSVMESFEKDFSVVLSQTSASTSSSQTSTSMSQASNSGIRWVIVFSPTGCSALLRSLNLLDPSTGRVVPGKGREGTYISSIGPTTRDYLREEFGFEVDVCAEKPSPEGVREGVERFMARNENEA